MIVVNALSSQMNRTISPPPIQFDTGFSFLCIPSISQDLDLDGGRGIGTDTGDLNDLARNKGIGLR